MSKTKVVEKKYLIPFILVTSLFALWGFANSVTDPMVTAFKTVLELSNSQASWVQMAFYGGYFCMALPAALFVRKYSYKTSILIGLGLFSAGALMFYPAAITEKFWFFCLGLYVLTVGLACLETSANTYMLALGPKETATQRLNLAQAFNPVGLILGVFVAKFFVLKRLVSDNVQDYVLANYKGQQLKDYLVKNFDVVKLIEDKADPERIERYKGILAKLAETPLEKLSAYAKTLNNSDFSYSFLQDVSKDFIRASDLMVIRNPYVILGLTLLAVLVVFIVSKMPQAKDEGENPSINKTFKVLYKNKKYMFGLLAQAANVAAQIMCWTYIYHYAEDKGVSKSTAADYQLAAFVLFFVGRALGTYMLRFMKSTSLLTIFSLGATVGTLATMFITNDTGLYALVFVSFCMSVMFPTIYGISLNDLNEEDSKIGAAGLVMAIVGGALMPRVQGSIIDIGGERVNNTTIMGVSEVNFSFVLSLTCFVIIVLFSQYAAKKLKTQ